MIDKLDFIKAFNKYVESETEDLKEQFLTLYKKGLIYEEIDEEGYVDICICTSGIVSLHKSRNNEVLFRLTEEHWSTETAMNEYIDFYLPNWVHKNAVKKSKQILNDLINLLD